MGNGITRAPGQWFKSTRSAGNGNCVEVRHNEDGTVSVRHSENPDGARLNFTPGEWAAFIAGCKDGEFGLSDS